MNNPTFSAYFDGACEPINPNGTAAYGVVVFKDNRIVWLSSETYYPTLNQTTTNNMAEYAGFLKLLQFFSDQKMRNESIEILGDSKLVINQMFNGWSISSGSYLPLANKSKELLKIFPHVLGRWIPKEENTIADKLSRQAIKTFYSN